ncbi:hypothetical protein VTN02DRAFT_5996 [Thermoascus thermophilus]
MHVVEPLQRYPIVANAAYKPSPHTLSQALAFEASVGIENVVLVQPSIYGTDNSCLLDALRKLGPARARGVVVIDPDTIQRETLAQWHALGVRGVRVNLKSVGKVMGEDELAGTLVRHADLVRPFGWVVQLYVSLDTVTALERIVPRLGGVKVCLDHFGSPDLSLSPTNYNDHAPLNPYSLPGFSSLVSLLRGGQTYVKLSAPYRLSKDPQMRDLRALARELIRVAPDRLVFATDWPHTRFDGLDIRPFTESCLQWCAAVPGLAERLFRRNAEALWDVKESVKAPPIDTIVKRPVWVRSGVDDRIQSSETGLGVQG